MSGIPMGMVRAAGKESRMNMVNRRKGAPNWSARECHGRTLHGRETGQEASLRIWARDRMPHAPFSRAGLQQGVAENTGNRDPCRASRADMRRECGEMGWLCAGMGDPACARRARVMSDDAHSSFRSPLRGEGRRPQASQAVSDHPRGAAEPPSFECSCARISSSSPRAGSQRAGGRKWLQPCARR